MRSLIESTSRFMNTESGADTVPGSSLCGGFQPNNARPFKIVSGRIPLSTNDYMVGSLLIFVPFSLMRWGRCAYDGGSSSNLLHSISC